ncbi:MAG: tetratricopeptide repeat protein, partial [Candidatus Obscuribacterales bacterium]|nr:tetratricopeptide repeat protein [Steroidobacteraceae bacterium]
KQAAQTQQATDLLSRLTAAHPERSDVRTAIARLYVSAGRYEETLAQLRSAAGLSKEDGSIQLEIARTQVALSQFDDARNTVDALLQRTPSDLSTVALAAWLDIERGAKASAAARIAALRKQQPDEPRVRLAQGEILMAVGDPQAAVEAFESALKQMPASNVAFKAYLARAAAKLPNTTGPLEGYVESHPRDVSARAALAQALQESGQAGPAIKQYEKLLADGGPSAIALNNLAWLYHQVGDQRALATARQAVHLAPGNPAVVDTLGWILIRQNQAQEGVAILKTVLSRAANQSEIHYHYAVGLTKVGARGEARRVLTEALAQPIPFSGRDDAQRLLTELSSDAPVKG